jgi:hypothetical protein
MSEVCSLRLTRRYRATVKEVWDALVDGRWLGASGAELRVVEPRRSLELVFLKSIARIEIAPAPEGGGTRLVLEHSEILAPLGMRAMRIWSRALDRLEAAA